MREGWIAAGVVGLLGLFAAAALFDPVTLVNAGRGLMLNAIVVAVPFELAYFGALAVALRRHGSPRGWAWRSFDFHDLLSSAERRWVLPWFYVGTFAMGFAMLGVLVVVVGGLSALRSG